MSDEDQNPEQDQTKRTELIRAVVDAAGKRLRGEPIDDPLMKGLLDLLLAQSRQTDPGLDEQKVLENISRIPVGGELTGLLSTLDKKRRS